MDGREERPVTFLAAAGWTILLKLLFGLTPGLIEGVHPGAITDIVTITSSRVLALSITLLLLLRVHEPDGSVRRVVGLRMPPIGATFLAAIAGASLAVPATRLESLLAQLFPHQEDQSEIVDRLFATDTSSKRAMLFASLVIVLPICDELFFRGALFTSLRKNRRGDVVVLATAAYDLLLNTVNPRGMLVLLPLLVLLGWVRSVTGTVVPSIAARVGFFGALVGPGILGKPDLPTRAAWVAGGVAVAAVAFGLLGLVCRASPVAAAARDADEG